ncbi:MAG: glycosyltransferase family A protein [Acidobacteriota bacterium]
MKDRITVSVILPACDAAATLERAVSSIVCQSFARFELILVENGSSDETYRIASGWARRDPRIRIERLDRSDLVAALNRGIAVARGDYLARMDADDIAHPRRLEMQAAFLDEHPEIDLVACRVAYGGDPSRNAGFAEYVAWSNRLLSPEEIALNRFVESPVVHPSVMFRRSLVERYGTYTPGPFPEDYELWLRCLEGGARFAKLPEVLLTWSDSPARLTRTDLRYARDRFFAVKARYLATYLQRVNPHHPRIWLIGAGRVARRRARLLEPFGVEVAGYVDIDPRKIGHCIQGKPVISREEAPAPGEAFLVSFVAARGARDDIEAWLQARGHLPGIDYLLAA